MKLKYFLLLCTISVMSWLTLFQPVAAQEQKTYIIGTDTTFAPFEFQDVNGSYVGIDMDLIRAIAETENISIEIRPLGFSAALQALETGQIDGVIAGMSITDQRKQTFDFSNPYYSGGIGMAVHSNSGITSYEQLADKKVAVKLGTQGAAFAESIKDQYGFTVTTFKDSANMYEDVLAGNSVAAFEDYSVMAYAIKSNSLSLKMTDLEENISDMGFAVLKGQNQELLAAFNNGLAKLKANGKYDEIMNHYIGANAEVPVEDTSFIGLIKNNAGDLLKGLGFTLLLTFVSIFIAMLLGITLGLFKTSRFKPLKMFATGYIDIIRGIPLIVLVFFIYFGIPQATSIRFTALTAGVITLSLNAAAYIAEIVRSGIEAVDKGQYEAALSLGLPYKISMPKIILPQAIKIMIPNFINQFVITLKDTSLLSIIGIIELTQVGDMIIARNLQSSKMWIIIGAMYLIIITLLTKLSAKLERKE